MSSLMDENKLLTLTENYSNIIRELGEDPDRDGLLKTPSRASKAMQFLTQ